MKVAGFEILSSFLLPKYCVSKQFVYDYTNVIILSSLNKFVTKKITGFFKKLQKILLINSNLPYQPYKCKTKSLKPKPFWCFLFNQISLIHYKYGTQPTV